METVADMQTTGWDQEDVACPDLEGFTVNMEDGLSFLHHNDFKMLMPVQVHNHLSFLRVFNLLLNNWKG